MYRSLSYSQYDCYVTLLCDFIRRVLWSYHDDDNRRDKIAIILLRNCSRVMIDIEDLNNVALDLCIYIIRSTVAFIPSTSSLFINNNEFEECIIQELSSKLIYFINMQNINSFSNNNNKNEEEEDWEFKSLYTGMFHILAIIVNKVSEIYIFILIYIFYMVFFL